MKTMADLLNDLFRTHRRQDGREYTASEVARAITEELHGELDPSYLTKMRNGQIENPTRNTLLLLCRFFKVPANYFFPELDLQSPPEEGSIHAALRATDLEPEVQAKLEELIQAMQNQRNRC